MNKTITAFALVSLLALPALSLAFDVADVPEPGIININLLQLLEKIFDFVWPIVVAVVIILFILAGFLFLTAQGDANKTREARLAVIWGVVGVAVIILAYSIINIVNTQLTSTDSPIRKAVDNFG